MAMVMGCQWDGAMLALKSQQPVMFSPQFVGNYHVLQSVVLALVDLQMGSI